MVDEKKVEKMKENPKCSLVWGTDGSLIVECERSEDVVETTKRVSDDGIHIRQIKIKEEKP